METKLWQKLSLWVVLSALFSCGNGGESAGPIQASFTSSVCKKDKTATARMARMFRLLATDNPAGLEGLRCIAWKRVEPDRMQLDLINLDSACGVNWVGDAAQTADGTLELRLDNPSCNIAACGSCLYDTSFDLHSLSANPTTQVSVTIDTCKTQGNTKHWTMGIGPEPQGIRCVYAEYSALNWHAAAMGTCGRVGMPCAGSAMCGSGSFSSTGTCDSGLTCDSRAAINQPRCLAPCATTADCPRADAWSCQEGLCRPAGE